MPVIGLVLVLAVPAQMDSKKDPDRPQFGVTAVMSADDARKAFLPSSIPARPGVYVVRVERYSPASKAQIQAGDVITSVKGKRIRDPDGLQAAIAEMKVGEEVTVELYRPAKVNNKLVWPASAKRGKLTIVSRRDVIAASTDRNVDKVQAIEFVHHKDTPNIRIDPALSVYFMKRDGKPVGLRLKVSYAGDGWVFASSWVVRADDAKFEFEAKALDVNREILGGTRVMEWYDMPVDAELLKMLRAISTAKEATVRYAGKERAFDHTVGRPERDRIALMIEAYEILGGTFPE